LFFDREIQIIAAKMLQSAVVSIAFLAVFGQGQTSMLHRRQD
jgi:hypothetical protein